MVKTDISAITKLPVEQALDSMSDAFILLDRDFRVAYVNPAAEASVKTPRELLFGHSHWELWPSSVGTDLERRYRHAMATGEAQHFQHRYTDDRLDLWIDVNAYPVSNGLAIYYRDISEQHRQQENARRIERSYKAALSNTPDLVYVFDLNHRFAYANEALLKMWGRTWDEAIGKNCLQLGYPDWHAAMHDREIEQVIATRQPIRGEVHFDGTEGRRLYDYIFVPVLGENGEVESVAGTTRDITERQQAEDALRRSEKLATAGRLASSIAHEINNPLEAVTNLLYLMDGDSTLSEEARSYLRIAQSELGRVSQIATQTLRFYRQNSGPTREPVSAVFDSVLALFDRRIADAGIQIHRRASRTPPALLFAGELRQVVANLVGNALDALERGGRIYLRDRPATDWRTGRKGLTLTNADAGQGMDAGTQARIFEAFYSTKATTGTGLGLWVSKELIEKHGGHIRVRSSQRLPHRGTVFTIFLPEMQETATERTA